MPDTDKPKSAEPILKQPTWRQRDYTAGSNEAKVLIAPDGVEYGPMFPGTADGLESRIATTHQALLDAVAALAKYGEHRLGCPQHLFGAGAMCDCGFEAALARVSEVVK